MTYINLAFYYFFEYQSDLNELRSKFKTISDRLCLKGTILLAPEGINIMISGTREAITQIEEFLIDLIQEENLHFKESESDRQPFKRMLVKVKEQLIPVEDPSVNPRVKTADKLAPEMLKQWYEEHRDMIVLDTRNNFEYAMGTFENAIPVDTKSFREFEDRVKRFPEEWKEKTVVTFCTGGIRCEKATPIMMKYGFKNIFQLDGGILNYFEKVGSDHYQGDCFVFDQRIAIDPNLNEKDISNCPICDHPVSKDDQHLKTFHYGVCCPNCYDSHRKRCQ